jgi:hypothetical protein
MEDDGRPLALRQGLHGLADPDAQFVGLGGPLGIGPVGRLHVLRDLGAFLAAEHVVAQVHDDAIQPGREPRVRTEGARSPIHPQERLLANVLGLVVAAEHADRQRMHSPLVAAYQFGQSRGVAPGHFGQKFVVELESLIHSSASIPRSRADRSNQPRHSGVTHPVILHSVAVGSARRGYSNSMHAAKDHPLNREFHRCFVGKLSV